MKKLQKFFALALALMLVLGMAAPVMAAEDDLVITITNPDKNSSSEHIYEAYQILSGTLSSDGTKLANPTWGDHVNGEALLAALKVDTFFGIGEANPFSNDTSAADFADSISASAFNTNENIEHLAKVIEANLKPVTDTDKPYTSTEEDAPYTIRIPKDKAGYYLIKDKDGSFNDDNGNPTHENKDYTEFMLQVVKSVEVRHKGSIPTIDKQVSDTVDTGYGDYIDAAMATTYYYKLTGTLPSDYAEYDEYTYEITDTMSAGIDFGEILAVYVQHRAGGTTDLAGYYTVTEPTDTENKLIINFEDLKANNNVLNLLSTDKIIVVYTATLNENAIIAGDGNENTVYLEYSNNPSAGGTGKTNDDKTKTYTFDLELVKIDGTTKTPLANVEFYLYRQINVTDGGASSQAIQKQYVVVDNNGKVTGWTPYLTDEDVPGGITDYKLASVLKTDANGKLNVSGLDASVYYLHEIKTNDGYHLLLDDIRVTVSATYANGEFENISAETNYGTVTTLTGTNNNAIGIQLTVPNYQGNTLPTTGGVGTTMFYVFGSILVIAAVALLVTKKRMSA